MKLPRPELDDIKRVLDLLIEDPIKFFNELLPPVAVPESKGVAMRGAKRTKMMNGAE